MVWISSFPVGLIWVELHNELGLSLLIVRASTFYFSFHLCIILAASISTPSAFVDKQKHDKLETKNSVSILPYIRMHMKLNKQHKNGWNTIKTLLHLYYYYKNSSKKLKANKFLKYLCLLSGKFVNENIFNYFPNLLSHLLLGM